MTRIIRRLGSVLLLAAWAVLRPGSAEAQRADQRTALAEWQAHVEAITDPAELSPLLAPSDSANRDKTARLLDRLRRGITLYRLGALTHDRRYYDDALEDFWSVLLEKYRWPYAWYGLGITKVAMAREGLLPYQATHQPPGSTYAEEAMEALRRALEHDRRFAAAAAALAGAERGDAKSPALRDSAVVLLERARELFGAGEPTAGLEAHRAAMARGLPPQARARLRADLAWIADAAELRGFDATPPAALPGWLDEFWERRDVRDVRRPGERLAEHYPRLVYAERHFTRLGSNTANMHFERVSRADRTLDDRAVIYIRHGEPQQRASFGSPFRTAENIAPQEDAIPPNARNPATRPGDQLAPIPPNLSWKYERPERDLLFHFVAHQGGDYRLIESLLDVFSLDTVLALQMGRERHGDMAGPAWEWARFAQALVSSRVDFDPLYTRLANSPTIQGSGNLQRERAAGQHSIEVGTTSDSYHQVFAGALETVIQAYGLSRGESGRVLLVVAVSPGRGGDAPIAVTAVVSTQEDRRLVQVDTILSLTPWARASMPAAVLELPAPEGTHRVRVVAADTIRDAAGATTIDEVVVPAASGPPTLSDLVLGEQGGPSWRAPDGVVWLDADGAFAPGATAHLYYQAAGLTPGATYRTRIVLHRSGDRRQIHRIASEFDVVAASSKQAERRELSLAGLRKGEYVLQLTLGGPGGRVTRTRTVVVR